MSTRRPRTARPRRPLPGTRRSRAALSVVAVAALLATAGFIGSGGRDGDERFDTVGASIETSGGGSSEALAVDESGAGGLARAEVAAPVDAETSASMVDTDRSGDGSAADATGAGGGETPGVQPKIIRTGSLELEVEKGTFDEAVRRLSSLATGVGGFVSASETTSLGREPSGTVTIRVPSKDFDRIVGSLGDVGKVQAVTTGSQDVTGEYTDVASRLKALEAEREQIQLVLGRAETIPDILSVRDRLTVVQGEIETLQGRQKVLDDQTSLSTLTVSLYEKGTATTADTRPVERTGFSKLWHDSADRFVDGARSIALGLATLAPWLILALVVGLPLRAVWRRMGPETPAAAGPPPATTAD